MGIGKGNQWRIELGRDAYLVIFIFEIVREKTKANDIGGMVCIMSIFEPMNIFLYIILVLFIFWFFLSFQLFHNNL